MFEFELVIYALFILIIGIPLLGCLEILKERWAKGKDEQ